jgi:hypothetical protein
MHLFRTPIPPEYEFATNRVLDVAKAGEAIRAFLQK